MGRSFRQTLLLAASALAAISSGAPRFTFHSGYLPEDRYYLHSHLGGVDRDGNSFACFVLDHGGSLRPNELILTKFDPLGATLWTRSLPNFPQGSSIYKLLVASDGSVYLAGREQVFGGDFAFVRRVSPEGVQLWRSGVQLSNVDSLYFSDGAIDSKGNVIMLGREHGFGYDGEHPAILKFTPSGAIAWVRRYERVERVGNSWGSADYSTNLVILPGDIYATVVNSSHETGWGGYVFRLDSNGNGGASELLDPAEYGHTYAVAGSPRGNLFTATSTSNGAYREDSRHAFQLTINGTRVWKYTFPLVPHYRPLQLAGSPDGGVYVVGDGQDPNVPNFCVRVYRFTSDGVPMWNYASGAVDTTAVTHGKVVAVDRAGSVYLTGPTRDYDSPGTAVIQKISRWGQPLWTADLPAGDGQFKTDEMALGPSGSFFAFGFSTKGGAVARFDLGAPLAGFRLGTNAIDGGNPLNAKVVLQEPAPRGGVVIALHSDNPNVIVPEEVMIPRRETVLKFPITTLGVGADETATITATSGGVDFTEPLTIKAGRLRSFEADRTELHPGDKLHLTVRLTKAASKAVSVVLRSDDKTVLEPIPTLSIPAGQLVGETEVTTLPTTTIRYVTLSANQQFQTMRLQVTVKPGASARRWRK